MNCALMFHLSKDKKVAVLTDGKTLTAKDYRNIIRWLEVEIEILEEDEATPSTEGRNGEDQADG